MSGNNMDHWCMACGAEWNAHATEDICPRCGFNHEYAGLFHEHLESFWKEQRGWVDND